jgi:hypothetical protein
MAANRPPGKPSLPDIFKGTDFRFAPQVEKV